MNKPVRRSRLPLALLVATLVLGASTVAAQGTSGMGTPGQPAAPTAPAAPAPAPAPVTPPVTPPVTAPGAPTGGTVAKQKKGAEIGAKRKVETKGDTAVTTQSVTLSDLAAGKLEVTTPTLVDGAPGNASCQVPGSLSSDKSRLTVQLDQLSHASGNTCQPLVTANPSALDVAVTIDGGKQHALLQLKPAVISAPPAVRFTVKDAALVSATGEPLNTSEAKSRKMHWVDGGKWKEESAGKLSSEFLSQLGRSNSGLEVYVNFSGNGEVSDPPIRATISQEGSADGSDSPNGDDAPMSPPSNWCKRNPVGYTVCLDFYDDALSRRKSRIAVYPTDTNQILRPNTSIRVVVLRRRVATSTIELGGEQGVFVSTDRHLDATGGDGGNKKQSNAPKPPAWETDERLFAPRLPGNANLTVTVTEGGKEQLQTVEFVVEQTYIGAVRVGASLVFGATDRAYEARAVAGSKQSEIAVSKKSMQDLELVVGYSAYLSPRAYANPSWSNFEPYVGIGVLNQGPTALETLKSLHFGIEWEPSPNFGIAATGVVRRVERLADGYRVGSPISGDVPTVEKAELGFGLVFNLSPDFLRIAKQSGSTFFK